jgi:hypothetical protein
MNTRKSYGLGELTDLNEESLIDLVREILGDIRDASYDAGAGATLAEMAFDRLLNRIERREAPVTKPE